MEQHPPFKVRFNGKVESWQQGCDNTFTIQPTYFTIIELTTCSPASELAFRVTACWASLLLTWLVVGSEVTEAAEATSPAAALAYTLFTELVEAEWAVGMFETVEAEPAEADPVDMVIQNANV